MATTYEPASAAEEIAEGLIPDHHKHLQKARIIWLKTSAGQSKARATNALMRHLAGKDLDGITADFIVVVTDVDWYRSGPENRRVALVDTLLCSMTRQSNADTGKDRWAIAKPDVSMFLAVVKRHGLSTTEEQQVGKLIKDLPEQLALAMDGDDEEDGGDEVGADEDEPARPGWEDAPKAPPYFPSTGRSDFGPPDESWEDATRPELDDQAVREIRGSVEAAAR